MGRVPQELEQALVELLGREWVLTDRRDLLVYGYDATGEKHPPDIVVMPTTTGQVATCVRLARQHRLPVIARGAGTNLSGGTLPIHGGMVINLVRMNRVRRIDPAARIAVVECGVTNLALQKQIAPHGFFFAPDPSSQKVATIGGNLAENAGGPRCAKYGVVANHVLGLEMVLADGSLVELGGEVEDAPGLDLLGLAVGAEGTLGVITSATVRLTPLPAASQTMLAVFGRLRDAVSAVSGIVASRTVPAALELIDRKSLGVIRMSNPASFPADAEAVLLIEVDGDAGEVAAQVERIRTVVAVHHAMELRVAGDEAERQALWAARRATFGALARVSANLWSMDITVPRDRLVEMMENVVRLGEQFRLPVYTVAHAGDGNMHPTVPFNPAVPDEVQRVRGFDAAVQAACVSLGGSITGEHGVGIEKLPGMRIQFGEDLLACMNAVRTAFDPDRCMNPGKAVPGPIGGF